MKIIKDYHEFILESILVTSDEFKAIVGDIDDPVAKKFYGLLFKDISTKYNAIDISNYADKVSFISDAQFDKKVDKIGKVFSDKNNLIKIGRAVNSILKDNKIITTEKEIENFVNKFKAKWEILNNIKIDLVDREDIRNWYHENNYCKLTKSVGSKLGKGSLGKSCMRYHECQNYLDIYVENPNECEMIISVDSENKLRARALLWKTNKGRYLDRIYYTFDSDKEVILDWVYKNFGKIDGHDTEGYGHIINLTGPNNQYDEYPYMDTFEFYHPQSKRLCMGMSSVDNVTELLKLNETDGSYNKVYAREDDEDYWGDYNRNMLE